MVEQNTQHFMSYSPWSSSGLLEKYEIDVLPMLSVRNVRELLRAAIPLPQLSIEDAADLVVKHLTNRTRSRKSRLRKQQEKDTVT